MITSIHSWRALSLTCLALTLSLFTFAQTKISGTITDLETNEPLVGAYVVPVGASGGAISTPEGKFELTLPESITQFKVSFVGYSDQTIDVGNQRVFDKASLVVMESGGPEESSVELIWNKALDALSEGAPRSSSHALERAHTIHKS